MRAPQSTTPGYEDRAVRASYLTGAVIPLVPGKVLAFNRLAKYLCKIHRVYHVHALKSFLSSDGDFSDPTLFNDHIHLSQNGTSVMNVKNVNKGIMLASQRQLRLLIAES